MLKELIDRSRVPVYAFIYWLVFLLALDPSDLLQAREMLRICVAALLGCSSAPLLIALARRFPIAGPRRARRIAIHVAGAIAISFVLIVVSCFLAAWILMAKPLPTLLEIRGQLAANWLLLTFALGAFSVLSHVLNLIPRPAKTIPIKSRGRLGHLDLDTIEWIESQGNYLALHVGGKSHLVRETMQAFAERLDPARFIRVHRRVIVDAHHIREIQPLANGDCTLILQDGHPIRASRSYREAVRRHWADVMAQR
jgi:two-component system LytT family response regulator